MATSYGLLRVINADTAAGDLENSTLWNWLEGYELRYIYLNCTQNLKCVPYVTVAYVSQVGLYAHLHSQASKFTKLGNIFLFVNDIQTSVVR